ncbi:MAG: ice-binding family protein [Burkholderiales bacterium]
MDNFGSTFKPRTTLLAAVLAAAFVAGCGDGVVSGGDGGGTGGGSGPGPAGASPSLGTAGTYGVFASDAAVTLAADSLVEGDVGLNPNAACNNCVVGVTVTGEIHNGDAEAIQAQSDFGDAYTDAANRTENACTIVDSELSSAQADCNGVTNGPTYVAGLYRTANPIGIGATFTITLDAKGNPDAVFIFQTDAAITTGTSSTVILANGAQAKNVWWMAGTAATLGVSSDFKGTVIANSEAVSVLGGTVDDRTLVEGRLFSSAAAVSVEAFATVTVPQ